MLKRLLLQWIRNVVTRLTGGILLFLLLSPLFGAVMFWFVLADKYPERRELFTNIGGVVGVLLVLAIYLLILGVIGWYGKEYVRKNRAVARYKAADNRKNRPFASYASKRWTRR